MHLKHTASRAIQPDPDADLTRATQRSWDAFVRTLPGQQSARKEPDDEERMYQEAMAHMRAEDGAWERAFREAVELYGDDRPHNRALLALSRRSHGATLVAAHILLADRPREAHDDWLELTDLRDTSGRSFMKLLGIPEAEWVTLPCGLRGYKTRRQCGDIALLTDGTEEMGAHLIVTGDGCRELEARDHLFSWQRLARQSRDKYGMRCGRLDLFRDERAGELTVDAVRAKLEAEAWTSRSQDYDVHVKRKRGKGTYANAVGIGSRASERYMRVYDKALELAPRRGKHSKREEWLKHHGAHVRFELECKDRQAEVTWAHIAEHGVDDKLIAGLMARFMELKEAPAEGKNANRVKPWDKWLAFLKNAPHVVLQLEYVKKPLHATQEWLQHQAAVALWQLWCKHGGDVSWLLRMIRDGASRAKPHHHARLKGEGVEPPRVVERGMPWTVVVNRDQLAA